MSSTLNLPHLKGLQLADPRYMDGSHIDVLLGAGVFTDILDGEIIRSKHQEPAVIKIALGWVLSANVTGESIVSSLTSLHICDQCDLDKTLQSFWLQEALPKLTLYLKMSKSVKRIFCTLTHEIRKVVSSNSSYLRVKDILNLIIWEIQ